MPREGAEAKSLAVSRRGIEDRMSAIVRFHRRGDSYPITVVIFGQYAKKDAARRAAELEADDRVIWVEVNP